MHSVAAVIGSDYLFFDLAVVGEVFGWDRSYLGVDWYELTLVAAEPAPLTSATGITVARPRGLEALETADTIVVPGWADVDVPPSAELVTALRAAHRRGTRIMSICTGSFVLAEAGLLDGRPATTHWLWADRFRARYPRVHLEPNVLYVDDGDILTSAGTVAGLHLCLHVVRCDHGAEVANRLARIVVMPPHREGGQAQYIDEPLPRRGLVSELQPAIDLALRHLAEPLSVERLAREVAMSPRTFARRFRQVTGTSPGRWLLDRRVELARRLLETTDQTVESIAHECGFGTAGALRHHFTERLHTSPSGYRRTFRHRTVATSGADGGASPRRPAVGVAG